METYLIIFLALCLAATGTALYRYQRQIHRICRHDVMYRGWITPKNITS